MRRGCEICIEESLNIFNQLLSMGIKQLPHFENLLHIFAMQYKISVQGNVEAVCLLSKLHDTKEHVNVT